MTCYKDKFDAHLGMIQTHIDYSLMLNTNLRELHKHICDMKIEYIKEEKYWTDKVRLLQEKIRILEERKENEKSLRNADSVISANSPLSKAICTNYTNYSAQHM